MFANKEEIVSFNDFIDHFNTPLNLFYAIFVVIWTTFFTESWKRKQNVIGNSWLMREFKNPNHERSAFKGAWTIDKKTKAKDKVPLYNAYWRYLLVGVPVTILFVLAVILA